MSPTRVYKKTKKTTVQLTSLLDLLFVMIFVSLIQQKAPTATPKKQTPKKVTSSKVTVKKAIKKTPPAVKEIKVISATFHFYPVSKDARLPDGRLAPSGKYLMQGNFDEKTNKLNLVGFSWIDRPTGYDMVPLKGILDSAGTSFKGKVDSPWCKQFTLTRKSRSGNSLINGQWQGVYDCGQGQTGLTLTVE